MRGLSKSFFTDLKSGCLKPILAKVLSDSTLQLEIRNNEIHIYYRGGRLLKCKANAKGFYDFTFDKDYFNTKNYCKNHPVLPTNQVSKVDDGEAWIAIVPVLKDVMDTYFSEHLKNEREFQQVVAYENNVSSVSNSTDYYISDIEYQSKESRFDLVGIKWASTPASRKNNENIGLALIEMKFGDSAIKGSSGLIKHCDDVINYLNDNDNLTAIKDEMLGIINTKIDLELLPGVKQVECFGDDKVEFIILLANHDPDKTGLKRELMGINSKYPSSVVGNIEIKVAQSSPMGYGLYRENIILLKDYLQSIN